MCVSTSTKEENRTILKGGQNFTSDRSDRSDRVCSTQEEAEMRLDDKINVTRNLSSLIVTGLTMTTGESCRHLPNRCATLDSRCVLTEDTVTEHDARSKSACSPCVLPYIHDKLLSCLALNVCGMLSKIKYPDFVSFISNYGIIAISESKLDDTGSVDVPGYVAFYQKRGEFRWKLGGLLLSVKAEIAQHVTIFDSKDKKPKFDRSVQKHYRFVNNELCAGILFFKLSKKIVTHDVLFGVSEITSKETYYNYKMFKNVFVSEDFCKFCHPI